MESKGTHMTAVNGPATIRDRKTQAAIMRLGGVLARYGLVVVIGWIGLLKFTSYEARGIQPH